MTKEEAIKILKDFHDKSALFSVRTALETLYPELKGSEGEQIRKAILNEITLLEKECVVEELKEVYRTWISWLEKQGEQKPNYTTLVETGNGGINALVTRELPTNGCDERKSSWSEEDDDDAWMNDIISKVENNLQLNKAEIEWLKSLKDRVQPKQEWSEEDKNMINKTLAVIKLYYDRDGDDLDKQSCISWLKSLRPQNRWKPSDEQMEALAWALSLAKNCGEEDLRTLQDQLKKLREE